MDRPELYRGLHSGTLAVFASFCVPHWFVIAAVAALASVLNIKPIRKFSLRTPLIATTLVTVVLGIAIAARRQ
jgi:hypothetical protein